MEALVPLLPFIGPLLGLLCLWAAFRAGKQRRLIENLPTSKTTGVFIGLVELKGTAESAQPLRSYLAGAACVYYAWEIEEHWSRTVTETYTDKDGKTQHRTRHESGWKSVGSGAEMIPFYLRDDCGTILIRPKGAKLEPVAVFEKTCYENDPLYYGKGPAWAVADSDRRRRFTERAIPVEAELYVMGQARERSDVVAPEIAEDPEVPMFLISTRSEEKVRSGREWSEHLWMIAALLLFVGGTAARDAALDGQVQPHIPVYVALFLGGGLVACGSWVWLVYNSLVDLRNRVRRGWSLIDIQLKRRHDLIPNLVNTVKAFRDYEAQLQTELAAMRTQLQATPPGVPGPDFTGLAPTLLAISERYPELKADTTFLQLQQNLVETEQRIALARAYYNDIVTHYNTRLEIVPERYVASLAGLRPESLLSAESFERAPVVVEMTPVER